jgi:5-methylcytosine-specific restriction endonuclease McrA
MTKSKDGLQVLCKTCDKKRAKAYYEKNKEKKLAKDRERYERNKEKILERHKEQRKKDPERFRKNKRKTYLNNRESILESVRRYRKENPEKFQESIKKYRENNREKVRQTNREWRKRNPDYKSDYYKRHPHLNAEKSSNRRALIRKCRVGRLPKGYKQIVYDTQKGKCWWCGKKLNKEKWHVDHLIPLSKDGKHCLSNMVASCPACNWSKSNKLPHEFMEGRLL